MTAAPRRLWTLLERFWQSRERRLIELYGPRGDMLPDSLRPPQARFSLKAMFVAVTVVATVVFWLGWQWRVVQQRVSMRRFAEEHGVKFNDWRGEPTSETLPFIRRVFGDALAPSITLPSRCWGASPITDEKQHEIERLFPEAEMWCEL